MTQLLTVEELYAQYHKKIYGYVYQHTRNHADAEDITADIFAKVIEKFDTFDPEKASYSTWIFTITKNRVITHFRQRRESEDIEDLVIADTAASPIDKAILKSQSQTLAAGLQRLSEKDRDIIIARYYYDYSFKQIAELMGMTEANARVTHGRALKKLKDLIGDDL